MIQRGGRTILCIGNDLVRLNLRCSLLKEYGWNVLSSGSGYEGVIRFGQETVDAVVLDLNHDGAESALIAAELKRQRPDLLVVMVVTDKNVLVPGSTEQADATVLKSEESKVLQETLRNLLRSR